MFEQAETPSARESKRVTSRRLPYGIAQRPPHSEAPHAGDTSRAGSDKSRAGADTSGAGAEADLSKFCELYGWGCGVEDPSGGSLFPGDDGAQDSDSDSDSASGEDTFAQKTEARLQAVALNYLARSFRDNVVRACNKAMGNGGGAGYEEAQSESDLVSTLSLQKAAPLLSGRTACVSKHMLHVFCVLTQNKSPMCMRTIRNPESNTVKQVAVWPAEFRLNTLVAKRLLVRAVANPRSTPLLLLKGEGESKDVMPGWTGGTVTRVTGLGFRGECELIHTIE